MLCGLGARSTGVDEINDKDKMNIVVLENPPNGIFSIVHFCFICF